MSRILAVVALLLASCVVSAQQLAPQAAADDKTVLLLNVIESDVTNSHLGVTVFSNYEKKLANDWDIPGWASQQVTDLFQQGGYRVIALAVPADRVAAIRSYKHTKTGWSKFKLEPGFASWLWSEMDKAGAAHAFILQNFAKQYAYDVPVKYSGYGVLSLHGKQPRQAFLYANIGSHFVSRGQAELPNGVRNGDADCRIKFDPAAIAVDDYERLAIVDLLPYRERIQSIILRRIRQDLTFAKLIPGDFEKCAGF
ncbi:MAG: hypothetical protein RR969_01470 [Thermomonas sp.]|jgi:hypothetical protein